MTPNKSLYWPPDAAVTQLACATCVPDTGGSDLKRWVALGDSMLRTFSFLLMSLCLASAPRVALSEDQPRTPETACVHFKDKTGQEDGTSFYDYPVLYEAIERRNVSLALCLIREGVPVDESGYNDWTPLSRASQYGLLKVVEALLEKGADAMRHDALGRIPYDYATEFYWKYSSGDYPIGYLGTDPESRILEYREIVKALQAAQMRGKW